MKGIPLTARYDIETDPCHTLSRSTCWEPRTTFSVHLGDPSTCLSLQKPHLHLSSCEVARAPICSLATFAMLTSKWLSILILLSSSYAASVLTSIGGSSNSTQRRDSTSYIQAAYFTNWYRLSTISGHALTPLLSTGAYMVPTFVRVGAAIVSFVTDLSQNQRTLTQAN